MGHNMLNEVSKELESENVPTREQAAKNLGAIGLEAIQLLMEAAKDGNISVQRSAEEALCRIANLTARAQMQSSKKDQAHGVEDEALREAEALGEARDEHAIQSLMEALKDADYPVRVAAATALTQLGSEAIQPLIEALGAERLQRIAARALREIGESIVHPLIEALKNQDVGVRVAAVEMLGQMKSVEAVIPLLEALKDQHVQDTAAWALGKIGDPQAIPMLLDVLGAVDCRAVETAAYALGKIGDAKAIPALIGAMKNENSLVRTAAAHALNSIGDAAIEQLLKELENANGSIRQLAALTLERLGWQAKDDPQHALRAVASQNWGMAATMGSAAVRPLSMALEDADYSARLNAVSTLGGIGDPQAIEPLMKALKDEDWRVRRATAQALGEIRDSKAIQALVLALNDANANVRREAAWALGEIGNAEAVAPLVAGLQDEDREVSKSIVEALDKIGDVSAVESLEYSLNNSKDSSMQRVVKRTLERLRK